MNDCVPSQSILINSYFISIVFSIFRECVCLRIPLTYMLNIVSFVQCASHPISPLSLFFIALFVYVFCVHCTLYSELGVECQVLGNARVYALQFSSWEGKKLDATNGICSVKFKVKHSLTYTHTPFACSQSKHSAFIAHIGELH